MIYRLENEIWSVRLCTVIDFRGSIFSIQHLAFILNTVWGNNNNDNTCNKNDDKVMMGIHMYNNTALCSLNTPLQLELYFQRDLVTNKIAHFYCLLTFIFFILHAIFYYQVFFCWFEILFKVQRANKTITFSFVFLLCILSFKAVLILIYRDPSKILQMNYIHEASW